MIQAPKKYHFYNNRMMLQIFNNEKFETFSLSFNLHLLTFSELPSIRHIKKTFFQNKSKFITEGSVCTTHEHYN